MADPDIADIERRMNGAVDALKREFGGLRTGRASAALLDPIMVDAYGSKMPLTQVGTVAPVKVEFAFLHPRILGPCNKQTCFIYRRV